MNATKIEAIYDRNHGKAREGWYIRVYLEDGRERDVPRDGKRRPGARRIRAEAADDGLTMGYTIPADTPVEYRWGEITIPDNTTIAARPVDPDLGLAVLVAEDESGAYEVVAVIATMAEAKDTAREDMLARMDDLQAGKHPLCPYLYAVWARGEGGQYRSLASWPADVMEVA